MKNADKTRWEEDYELIDNEGLFEEYLEMSKSCTLPVSSPSSKLRGPGFKSWPGFKSLHSTVGGLVNIIMWSAHPG